MLFSIEKWIGFAAAAFAVLGGVALVILAGVTGVSVFFRYILRDPIFGTEDISSMSLTVLVAAAIVWTGVQKGHVSVNIIAQVFGRNVTRYTDLVARFLSLMMMIIATYALFLKGSCGFECGAITSNLSIVHSPFYYILGLAMGLYAALILTHLLIGLGHWNSRDPNEVLD